MNNNNSEPLMFIQTISNNVNISSNQMYFDSRYKAKKKEVSDVLTSDEVQKTPLIETYNELYKRVKMISNATSLGMKIICEVVLINGESLYGVISFKDDNSFLIDGNTIKYIDSYEINIQSIK